ncbi:MAG: hypothetical protein K5640_03060 [Treponema sp.]|nr:hypothetical protein [Treponema sp.]
MDKKADSSNLSWYSEDGRDNDVVLSTRLRLARNLASFPFPSHFRGDDADRVQALVFDAFSKMEDPDSFQMVPTENIDESGIKILTERGLLDNPVGTGLVMGPGDNIFCMVNSQDHVRIVSFAAGLDANTVFSICQSMDKQLQASLQFAASYDYGFLTSSVKDCGSGMKFSVRVHLPSVSYAGKIPEVTDMLNKNGLTLSACFGSGKYFSPALGSYYQIATTSSCNGSELDQLAQIVSSVTNVVETERKFRAEYAENIPTVVRDFIARSFAMVKFSHLITASEAIEIISNLKWGCNLELLSGIEHKELCALLYRVQEGHLRFVLKNSSFTFEKDVESDTQLKINRFRALILQEAFEKIQFLER